MSTTHDFWRDRPVFVTGCTGLVGAWTVGALLERGAHVVGLIRDCVSGSELVRGGLIERMDVVYGSVEDEPLLERSLAEYEIHTVFHLAAQTIVGIANACPLATFESNIKGTWCLLEAARRCGTTPQVIVASSDKAYGEADSLPYTEDMPLAGRHPYDVSKACADALALTYHDTYGMPVCVTRCGNFFGGGDLNWSRLVPGTIRAALRQQRPVLRSDGRSLRDYFYVKDGVHAYLHLAECMSRRPDVVGQAFNFSAEQPLSVYEMVQHIVARLMPGAEPVVRGDASHEIASQYLSAAKARQMLGWQARYGLSEALDETITWYRDYFAPATVGHCIALNPAA
jgi:CDP-glucose 4,6-dehydratase